MYKIGDTMYKIGDRFSIVDQTGWEYMCILAQVDTFKAALIDLESGNRWLNPVPINVPDNISQKEFDAMSHSVKTIRKVEVADVR